jgi:hypothetical protein
MTYYEHDGKRYTLDGLCKEKIVIAIRRVTSITGDALWFADINDLEGWQISESDAQRLAALYHVPLELH